MKKIALLALIAGSMMTVGCTRCVTYTLNGNEQGQTANAQTGKVQKFKIKYSAVGFEDGQIILNLGSKKDGKSK